MNTVKILHCADIHIGAAESFLGASADSRRFETLVTFERIADLCQEKGVQILSIAGDLFDSNTVEDRFFDAVFAKIASISNVKVVFAAGNHDPLNSQSPFLNRDLPENLYVLGTKDECITFEDLKTKVWGRSFENNFLKGEEKFSLKTDDSYINIMVQHGELKSDLNSEYNAITPAFVLNSGMDYIALGHVHKRSDIGKLGSVRFAYSGCPEGQGFDELDEKGVYIGEIGKGVCEMEFLPVSLRRHIHLKTDITGLADSLEISQKILETLSAYENFSANLYKIELTGSISADTEISIPEIESRIKDKVYFVKFKDSTDFLLDLETVANEASLKGIFVKKMLDKINSAEESEKPLMQKALNLGLKAFSSEVKYNED